MTGEGQLRILMLCQNDFGAPTEKQALGYAEQLARRGHSVMITIGRDPATIRSEGADRVPGVEVRAHRFLGPRLRRSDFAAARAFAPTLIHAFNSRVPTVAAAAQLSRATGAPVFVHFEDDEWRPPPQAFPGEKKHLPLARFVRRHSWRVYPPLWWQSTAASLRWVQRSARAFDALTPVLAEEVTQRMERPCSVVLPVTPRTIARSADTQEDLPIELPGANGSMVALYTGTVLPVYLPDLRLGLAGVAEAQRRGRDIRFVHAGHTFGFDPERLAQEAGMRAGSAHFLGYLPFRAMGMLLARADIALQPGPPSDFNRLRLPSKMQTYLESGVPTLTFAAGFGELLADREEVLKTYTDDVGELADRLVELTDDAELRARLRRGGPEAAARLFDPQANTDALLAHYRSGLAGDSGAQ